MNKIYYAHGMNIYGTEQEKRDIETLKQLLPGHAIYNPSDDAAAEEGYSNHGMKYFFDKVSECSVLAFRSFADHKIPKGVLSEINVAIDNGIPVFELPGFYNRALSVEDTRQYLIESGIR